MTASILKPENQTETSSKDNFRMRDILQTLPREVFEKDPRKAWFKVAVNVLMVGLGYWGLAISPWFLLPIVWIFTGTAMTGFFVIGHDCAHRSFSNRNWVNDLVGHLAMLPLIYPFHGWRVGHDIHHKHTNKLGVDNAWEPWQPEIYDNLSGSLKWFYRRMRGRFWWLGSVAHWAVVHFTWWKFPEQEQEKVRFSAIFVILGAAIGFPILIATTGILGFVKFWLLPWLVYHFWMSTFTIVHHTMPDIPFKPVEEWNEAKAQLSGTVHCDYPRWVEFLCHDINVHIPHHISTGIPWYNLRKANQSLRENWGEYLYETKFSWSLMKEISDRCHLYDPDNCYQSFAEFRQRSAE